MSLFANIIKFFSKVERDVAICSETDQQQFDVLFLCSADIDEIWIRSTAIACAKEEVRTAICVCGPVKDYEGLNSIYKETGVQFLSDYSFADAAAIECRLAITASSGLDRDIFPSKAKYFIHMPHSLASLHMIYPEDAFFFYDILFAAGPHHVQEYQALVKQYNLKDKQVYSIGYGKYDILRDAQENYLFASEQARKHVLVAPSWGEDNLVDKVGVELSKALLGRGYRVTMRPHPLFFYEDAKVLGELGSIEEQFSDFSIEDPRLINQAIYEADLLIGDYSGTSFEFYSLTQKPVVSVNVGLKEVNSSWRELEIEPIEISLRDKIGRVVSADVTEIVGAVDELTESNWRGAPDVTAEFMFAQDTGCAERAKQKIIALLGEEV